MKGQDIEFLINENKTLHQMLAEYKYDQMFFKRNQKYILYYTGLPDYEVLETLFTYVEPALKKTRILSKFEQLSMCLMRLHIGLAVVDLAKRFQVSKSIASRTFLDTIEVLYVYLKPHSLLFGERRTSDFNAILLL